MFGLIFVIFCLMMAIIFHDTDPSTFDDINETESNIITDITYSHLKGNIYYHDISDGND